MTTMHPLAGIYAAALTPFHADYSIDLDAVYPFMQFLAAQECHGALLFGTTGEGPSLSAKERALILQVAGEVSTIFPEFRLLVGTGTPSLDETIELTRNAFDLGCDGVVVLPPYYFRKVSDDGLFLWFQQVIQRAVPADGYLLGYHIPGMSGVPLSLDLLARLKDAFPDQFAGIKDSSGDPQHAVALGRRFGSHLLVLNGNDGLLLHAMEYNAGGAITAVANLYAPLLRQVWDIFEQDGDGIEAQEKLNTRRQILERYQPFPPILKAIMPHYHEFNKWSLRPPLMPVSAEMEAACLKELRDCEEVVSD